MRPRPRDRARKKKGAYKGLLLAAVARETTKGLFFTTTCTFLVIVGKRQEKNDFCL
jgi:hypothetical protein